MTSIPGSIPCVLNGLESPEEENLLRWEAQQRRIIEGYIAQRQALEECNRRNGYEP